MTPADLRVGGLLAEGGEGRIHLLPRQPHLVYKEYRRPVPRRAVEALVAWPGGLEGLSGEAVRRATAWPVEVVDDGAGGVAGLLLPRAPRRFAVRHRDGGSRLASLSYLTADPAHRSAAYGLDLPPPGDPRRLGIVYALARLLAVFESGAPAVTHGDLSTKNVLWSLQRAPEVFVLDCDNSAMHGTDGTEVGTARRRAMTPNWNDPAVPPGSNPRPETDRYSMALIFLRIVAAANFPVQGRQRSGEPVTVEAAVPPGVSNEVLADPACPLWSLCAAGLDVDHPEARPPAAVWTAGLEWALSQMGQRSVAEAVRRAQGDPRDLPVVSCPAVESPQRVRVLPVAAPRPTRGWSASPRQTPPPVPAVRPAGGLTMRTAGGPVPPARPAGPARRSRRTRVGPEVAARLVVAIRWLAARHRSVVSLAATPGSRLRAVRRLISCLAVDMLLVLGAAMLFGMAVAPVMGL